MQGPCGLKYSLAFREFGGSQGFEKVIGYLGSLIFNVRSFDLLRGGLSEVGFVILVGVRASDISRLYLLHVAIEEAQHLKKLIQDYVASFIKVGDKEKELGRTPIEPEVFKKTHVRKKEKESDPDVWVEERAERTFNDFHQYVAENLDSSVQLTPKLSTQIWKEKVVGRTHKGRCYGLGSLNDVRRLQLGLKGIGSSRQAKALDGVHIAAMSDQIAKLTVALAESERRRVTEQQSMSETVQQIKEQVMNLARRPTTSAPDDIDDESDEDDYVNLTP
ncbi:hypothetical protein MTR67_007314 [Solanum verrucosum]|uniref:Uncharacterized protein n=1 Tax=Solanum verrucosum TaxID=315347 RepID=A0AAF0TD03_SOLVR|nr:hypothetical protein MTR67_007314 [Solanum verrucosum]